MIGNRVVVIIIISSRAISADDMMSTSRVEVHPVLATHATKHESPELTSHETIHGELYVERGRVEQIVEDNKQVADKLVGERIDDETDVVVDRVVEWIGRVREEKEHVENDHGDGEFEISCAHTGFLQSTATTTSTTTTNATHAIRPAIRTRTTTLLVTSATVASNAALHRILTRCLDKSMNASSRVHNTFLITKQLKHHNL